MTVGGSIFLMALGAILRYAVTDSVQGISLDVVGLILMIAGAIGFVIGLWQMMSDRKRSREWDDPRPPQR